jgi:hypothetical protein
MDIFLASFEDLNVLALKCKYNLEFGAKSPLSGAEKHPEFQVTACHHFDTTNVGFAYIKSE